jgi:hypothetical protein
LYSRWHIGMYQSDYVLHYLNYFLCFLKPERTLFTSGFATCV